MRFDSPKALRAGQARFCGNPPYGLIDVRNPRPGKCSSCMSGGSLYNIRAARSRPAMHMLPATVRGLRFRPMLRRQITAHVFSDLNDGRVIDGGRRGSAARWLKLSRAPNRQATRRATRWQAAVKSGRVNGVADAQERSAPSRRWRWVRRDRCNFPAGCRPPTHVVRHGSSRVLH